MKTSFISTIAILICILVTQSQAQWIRANGIDSLQQIICLAHKDSLVFAGTSGGNSTLGFHGAFRSSDGGLSWMPIDSGLSGGTDFYPSVEAFAVSGSGLFAGTSSGVFFSLDNGTHWTAAGLTNLPVHTLLVKSRYLFAGTGAVGAYVGSYFEPGYGGIFRSTNNGSSWKRADSVIPNQMVTSLSSVDSVLLAAVYMGNIYRSTDDGEHWGASPTGGDMLSLVPSGSDLYVVEASGIFFSTDYGSTWVHREPELTHQFFRTLTASGSAIFVGSEFEGAFLSQDKGISWTPINEGWLTYPYARPVYTLLVSGSNLLAGTERGVWRRPLSEILTAIHQENAASPSLYSLYQNYPNPFNPSTTIRYALPNRSHVTLVVRNTLGQLVATLVNEVQDAGYHGVRFDGSGLASGVYFYRLRAGEYVSTKRLVLVR